MFVTIQQDFSDLFRPLLAELLPIKVQMFCAILGAKTMNFQWKFLYIKVLHRP